MAYGGVSNCRYCPHPLKGSQCFRMGVLIETLHLIVLNALLRFEMHPWRPGAFKNDAFHFTKKQEFTVLVPGACQPIFTFKGLSGSFISFDIQILTALPDTTPYSEQELLLLIAKGDEAAFAILFNNYRNKIYSIAYELTESAVIAEEIVQDTFLKIWLRRESFGEVTYFKAYLFTIARNYVITALKNIARRQNLEKMAVQDLPVFYSDTENQLVQKQYEEILKRAVNSLPAKQKQVYILVKEKGYKRNEVADELGLSAETVKTHLAQAMRTIRAYCLAHVDTLLLLLLTLRL